MNKQSLETAVGYAWEDLGNASVLVKMAAQDYVDAAQRTLDAFEEVQRQLVSIIVKNLNVAQAGQVMAELRKHPAGQLTVAFAHDTQLQVMLKAANDGKRTYHDARLKWREAVEAAEAAGCEPTERFTQPDEVVEADQAIEAEAQITDKITALRAFIENGAQHVDKIVHEAQSAHASNAVVETLAAASPSETPEPEAEPENYDDMLDGMTGVVAASAAAGRSAVTPGVQPAQAVAVANRIIDDIEEDESLPPPNAATLENAAKPKQRTSAPSSTTPLSDVARRMNGDLLDGCLAVAEATVAFEDAPRSDLPRLVAQADKAVKTLRASIGRYSHEILEPDLDKVQEAEGLILNASNVVAHAQRLIEIGPLIDKAVNESKVLQAAGEAYEGAQDTNTRTITGAAYKQAVEALMTTHAQLVASGKAEPDLLEDLGVLVDDGGVNLAKMANYAHVAAVSPQKDAHDLSWAPPVAAKGFENLARFAKPAGIGVAALLVVIAGAWIGSSGNESPTPPAAPPVASRVAPPASSAQAPAQAPPPVASKHTVGAIVHRPPVAHHVDKLAREQAQLNAANSKLDAWAKAQGVHP